MANKLEVVLSARNETSAAFQSVRRDMDSLESKAKTVGGNFGNLLKAGGLVAAGGIGAAGFALASFTKMAAKEEAGIKQLTQAVKNTGYAFEDAGNNYDEVIEASEDLAFADDEVRASLVQLLNATNDTEEAQRRLAIAQDLARGTGMDLEMASKLVGKVSEDNIQVLKRYGITLSEGATEQEALAEIQKKFAGQSATYATTATAKWERFNNELDNLKETIGAGLLPVATELGEELAEFLDEHQDEIQDFVEGLGEDIPRAIEKAQDAFEAVAVDTGAIDGWKKAYDDLKPIVEDVIDFFKDNRVAAIALAGGLAVVLAAAFPLPLAIIAIALATGILIERWDELQEKAREVWDEVPQVVKDALELIQKDVEFQTEQTKNTASTGWEAAHHLIAAWNAAIRLDTVTVWTEMGAFIKSIVEGWVEATKNASGFLVDILKFNFELAKTVVKLAYDAIVSYSDDAWETMKTAAANAINWIIEKINLGVAGINKIVDAANKVPGVDIGSVPRVPTIPAPGAPNAPDDYLPRLAMGIDYVPRDNMPALLHEGERVLTKRENEGYGGPQQVTNTIHITVNGDIEEGKIRKLEARLMEVLMKAQTMSSLGGGFTPSSAFPGGI